MIIRAKTRGGLVGGVLRAAVVAAVAGACSGAPVGGPVTGPLDGHCLVGGKVMAQAIGDCLVPSPISSLYGTPEASDVGATLFNAEGNDESCKYEVGWTSTAVERNASVTFDVRVRRLVDGN